MQLTDDFIATWTDYLSKDRAMYKSKDDELFVRFEIWRFRVQGRFDRWQQKLHSSTSLPKLHNGQAALVVHQELDNTPHQTIHAFK